MTPSLFYQQVIEYDDYLRTTTGLSILDGSCTSDGDSGGTWVGGVGQIQGIHIGGQAFAIGDACPTTFVSVFFQPIRDALDEFQVTMLTPHGSNAPTLNFAACPNMNQSGGGHYYCELKSADSQGEIEMLWTTNTGASSTQVDVSGSCSFMQTVNVTMKMTNPYGSTTKNYSFKCPMIPNQ